jgi:hydroxyacylglutathione hydrolase
MNIEIKAFDKGMLDENTYVVKDKDSNTCFVVDPGYYGSDVAECIGNAKLEYIFATHAHQDHVGALDKFKTAYPDTPLVSMEYKSDIKAEDNMVLSFGGKEIKLIATPGHSQDGMCILLDKTLFAGDTLFYMSVGATHFPGGDPQALFDSITKKLFILDDEVIVYPGHGKSTTIGFEKRHNPFV